MMSSAAAFVFGCALGAAIVLYLQSGAAATLGRGWIWDWQPEGSKFRRWYFAVAWDFFRSDGRGYDLLAVAIPLNFLVRGALLVRQWAWAHSRFGPKWVWVGIRHPRELAHRRRMNW